VLERNFLEQCGAKATPKDVHWPMTMSIRAPTVAPDGAQLRGSGLRQRSAKAAAARKANKQKRGFDKTQGRSSGSGVTAAPAAVATTTAAPAAWGSGGWDSGGWGSGGWGWGSGGEGWGPRR